MSLSSFGSSKQVYPQYRPSLLRRFVLVLFRICVKLWVLGLVFASLALRLDTRLANYST